MKRTILSASLAFLSFTALAISTKADIRTNSNMAVMAGCDIAYRHHDETDFCPGGFIALAIEGGRLSFIPILTYHTHYFDRSYAGEYYWPVLTRKTAVSLLINIRYTGRIERLSGVSPYVFSGIGGGMIRRHYIQYRQEWSENAYGFHINFGAGIEIEVGNGYSLEFQARYPTYVVDYGFSFSCGIRHNL